MKKLCILLSLIFVIHSAKAEVNSAFLSYKQLQKLSKAQQKTYLLKLTQFVYELEKSQHLDKATKNAFLSIGFLGQAEAADTAPVQDAAKRKKLAHDISTTLFNHSAEASKPLIRDLIKNYYGGTPPDANTVNQEVAGIEDEASPGDKVQIKKLLAQIRDEDLKTEIATAVVNKSESATKKVNKPNDKGTCLFGLWPSSFGASGMCQEPKEGSGCKAGEFRCNNFGIEELKLTCVSKRTKTDLKDLSAHCSEAVRVKIAAGEIHLNETEYNTFIDQLADKNTKAYCDGRGKAREPGECKALEELQDCVARNESKLKPAAPAATTTTSTSTAPQEIPCVKTPGADCLSCVINKQYPGRPISEKYMHMLEIMVTRCSNVNDKKQLSDSEKTAAVAKIIQSVGYCSNYKAPEGKGEFELTAEDIKTIETQENFSIALGKRFKQAYGLHPKHHGGNAQAVFCAKASDSNGDRQAQYEKEMALNRSLSLDGDFRHASGWEQCDSEIQMRQGRPYLSGVRKDTAKNYSDGGIAFIDQNKKDDESWKREYRTIIPSKGLVEQPIDSLKYLDWNRICTERNCQKPQPDLAKENSTFEKALNYCTGGSISGGGGTDPAKAKQ